jgi:hypothetical protein
MFLKTTILLFSVAAASAQETFQNLDFESANVTPAESRGAVPVTDGLPGWSAYIGAQQQTTVLFNYTYNSEATVDIFGPNWQPAPDEPGIIDGQYSAYIKSGVNGDGGGFVNASIEQSGTIPDTAQSLQFKAWGIFGGTPSVSFNGSPVALVIRSTAQSPSGRYYNVYRADIVPYAGQTGQLAFTQIFNTADPGFVLDDITFSTSSVPEPSPLALAALGSFLFALRGRFLRRSCS